MPQQRLDAWLLSDGHAGNVRQAQALADAAGWPAQEWALRARAPWRWLSPRALPLAEAAFGDSFAHALAGDLNGVIAIGCGRQGALATRLARARGARAVQILDPRISPRHWDLVVAPEHDGLHGENVIPLRGSLHPVDDAWLAAARATFATYAALPQPRVALLLGGASAHARWDEAFFDRLALQVQALLSREGGSVLATVSRRTPDTAVAAVHARLAALPGIVWRGDGDGVNPYAGLLAWADRIVATADSVNMLSEAAATQAPLFLAGVEGVSGGPRRFADTLLASGRARPWQGEWPAFDVEPLRETARVAREVRRRLAR